MCRCALRLALQWTFYVHRRKKSKGRALVIAPQVDTEALGHGGAAAWPGGPWPTPWADPYGGHVPPPNQ